MDQNSSKELSGAQVLGKSKDLNKSSIDAPAKHLVDRFEAALNRDDSKHAWGECSYLGNSPLELAHQATTQFESRANTPKDVAHIATQVAQSVSVIQGSGSVAPSVMIQLSDVGLLSGAQVNITLSDGLLKVSFMANSEEANAFLSEHAQSLREMLNEKKFDEVYDVEILSQFMGGDASDSDEESRNPYQAEEESELAPMDAPSATLKLWGQLKV